MRHLRMQGPVLQSLTAISRSGLNSSDSHQPLATSGLR